MPPKAQITRILDMIFSCYRADQLTAKMKDVLICLAKSHTRTRSFAALAKAAHCSRRTVAYAISQAEALGILTRSHTRAKWFGRVVNGPNAYAWVLTIAGRAAKPWKRSLPSQCKSCITMNYDKKTKAQGKGSGLIFRFPKGPQRSASDWISILQGLDAGRTLQEVGYSA